MKKIVCLMAMFLSLVFNNAYSKQNPSYIEEATALGSIAGQGLACRAKKYHKFELLARAIVVTKAKNDQMQRDGLRAFNEAKVNAFMDIESEKFSDCDEIVYSFNRQKIFEAVIYRNGKIKMPDGKVLVPRKEYDVSKLYKKDSKAFAKGDAAYKKAVKDAVENSKNQKMIKLEDASYADFANQFE